MLIVACERQAIIGLTFGYRGVCLMFLNPKQVVDFCAECLDNPKQFVNLLELGYKIYNSDASFVKDVFDNMRLTLKDANSPRFRFGYTQDVSYFGAIYILMEDGELNFVKVDRDDIDEIVARSISIWGDKNKTYDAESWFENRVAIKESKTSD